jgi:hypothetical protein
MSADLRLSDLMDSTFKETAPKDPLPNEASSSPRLSARWKAVMIGIISLGALGGTLVAYLSLTDTGRPVVDTSGKSLNVVINESTDIDDAKAVVSQKMEDAAVITNYFTSHPPTNATHPLDPAVVVAKMGLENIRGNVQDYTAVMHKQERIGKKLLPVEVMEIKIRHNGVSSDLSQSPMSVYVKFLKPKAMAGREVIWQKDHNKDRLTVHEYVFGRNIQLNLAPTGMLARKGNRYPMTEIGLETLILRMIEKGERDRQQGECVVNINRSSKINGRDCTMIEIRHPVEREHFEFHIAKIFIDDQLNVPISYSAYSWPKEEGGKPVLQETYTFTDLEINVGLTDEDFNIKNPSYDFPQ